MVQIKREHEKINVFTSIENSPIIIVDELMLLLLSLPTSVLFLFLWLDFIRYVSCFMYVRKYYPGIIPHYWNSLLKDDAMDCGLDCGLFNV